MSDTHATQVDAWLQRAAKDRSPAILLRLFEAALNALWNRTGKTLGEVTLTAIAERVLHNASEKFPLFSAITVEPSRGFQCSEMFERMGSVPSAQLVSGIRTVLIEFITVLGNLTAEILTAELHAVLIRVALPKAGRTKKGTPKVPSKSRKEKAK